jgi:hypothetical protein
MMPRFFAANAVIARLMVAPSAAQYLRAWDTAIVVVGVNDGHQFARHAPMVLLQLRNEPTARRNEFAATEWSFG